jgi:hypothetical protein
VIEFMGVLRETEGRASAKGMGKEKVEERREVEERK